MTRCKTSEYCPYKQLCCMGSYGFRVCSAPIDVGVDGYKSGRCPVIDGIIMLDPVTVLGNNGDNNTYTNPWDIKNLFDQLKGQYGNTNDNWWETELDKKPKVEEYPYHDENQNNGWFPPNAYPTPPNIPSEDKIKNRLWGKASCVFGKLNIDSKNFKDAINEFMGEESLVDLKFIMKDLGTTRGQCGGIKGNIKNGFKITIKINGNRTINGAEKRPNVLVAKTIIHEIIHAKIKTQLLRASIISGKSKTEKNISEMKKNLDKANFNTILGYYASSTAWSHDYMANRYRILIAKVMSDFDKKKHSLSYYKDLAWDGLMYKEIKSWKNNKRQTIIKKRIANFMTNNENQKCVK